MRHSFCCPMMELVVKDNSNEILIYYQQTRSYRIIDRCGDKEKKSYVSFKYCPWCARRMPSDLTQVRLEILARDYAILDPAGKDRERIPKEFLSDKWWKARNL
jgi:hypothetical protein